MNKCGGAGFWEHCSCVDLINTLHIILKQSTEWQHILYLAFRNSEKAFDSVIRTVKWQTLQEYGIPPTHQIINLIKEICKNYECQMVRDEKLVPTYSTEQQSAATELCKDTWNTDTVYV